MDVRGEAILHFLSAVQVVCLTTLRRLDRIIQTAMGWTNSHLQTFTAGGVLYSAFVYEYDMGDSWRHQVLVEEIQCGGPDGPVCLSGERACPPEDSGGVARYYEKLEILRDPSHDEHEHIKAWIESMTGGPFHPDAFDMEKVNAALAAQPRT